MMTLASLLPHIDGAGGMDFGPPPPSHEEELQAARDEAASAAIAEAEAGFEAKLQQLAAQHAEELQAARQRWCEEEAKPLAGQLLTSVTEAEHRLADALKSVLAPFIETLLPNAALQQLEGLLLPAIAEDLGSRITLQGPQDLVGQLAASLAARGATNIVTTMKNNGELQADCNGSQAVTRLAAWCEAVGGVNHG